MTPSQILDALAVSFFGLLGIWASVVRRHWFLRFTVVAGLLLLTLLVPVYEVLLEFGIQMAVISGGVWLARRDRAWRPRISMESALLAMVAVAVSSAVIAKIPDYDLGSWIWFVRVGVGTGIFALVCLWIVAGKASPAVRLIGGMAGIVACVALLQFGDAVWYAVRTWQGGGFWFDGLIDYYAGPRAGNWLRGNEPSVLCGVAISLTVLSLGRASGWFTARPAGTSARAGRMAIAARCGLLSALVVLAAPLVYLLVNLMSPAVIPVAALPAPNGYDDLLAGGRITPASTSAVVAMTAPTVAQLEAEVKRLAAALALIQRGLHRPSYVDREAWDQRAANGIYDSTTLNGAQDALVVRAMHAFHAGSTDDTIDALLDLALFFAQAQRGGGLDMYLFGPSALQMATGDLFALMGKMDAAQCRRTALRLVELDRDLEPLEECLRIQRASDENSFWATHLRLLLDDWTAAGPYETERRRYLDARVLLRGLIIQLSLRAYCLEHGEAPDALAALVPDYLSRIPDDPFGVGTFKFQRAADRVIFYSVGVNGRDDGGAPYPLAAGGRSFDYSRGDKVWDLSPAELGLTAAAAATQRASPPTAP